MTQRLLAERSGVTEYTISGIERDVERKTRRATMRALLKGLRLEWRDVRLVWPDETADEPAAADPEPAPPEPLLKARAFPSPLTAAERAPRARVALHPPPAVPTNNFAPHYEVVHKLLDAQAAKGVVKYPEDDARRNAGAIYFLRELQKEHLDGVIYAEHAIALVNQLIAERDALEAELVAERARAGGSGFSDDELAALRTILDRATPDDAAA
jgi:transcriptional regulator with XRE-family HTH domain